MRRKSILTVLVLVLCFTVTAAVNGFNMRSYTVVNAAENAASDSVSAQTENTAVTMREMADFLADKKEHYPLSDEFIERYQQASGGYLDTAKKAGLTVDKEKHEPNQKWHFFQSWLYPSIEDGTCTWESDARQKVYVGLKCPELLLWIFEASGVDPAKIKQAKDVAEQGRAAKTNVGTIAANMRKFVPWEDIANAVKGFKPAPSVTLNPSKVTLTVGEQTTITATLLNAGDVSSAPSWSVTEGESLVEITPNGNEVTVSAIARGTAKIKVSYGENLSAECTVTIKEQSVIDPTIEGSVKYNLSGKSTAPIKTAEDALSAFNLAGEDDGIIESIEQIVYISGGGYGGSGENRWSSTDMIKIGTGSNNGSITINLNVEVSRIIITGYVHGNKCEIRAGDSASTDWNGEQADGKTTTVTCSDMTVVSKSAIDEGNMSSVTIDFASTSSITIATVNATSTKYPLYITSIEFVVATDNGN